MTGKPGFSAEGGRNRLKDETSPYLLQHAANPVDWYPWGEEAFRKARLEDKPVFLSIGYSTCHWCHVMARESFEDPVVAGLMNEAFVAIKVDREERPDIDGVYMTVCRMMTGSGGWPLTIVMTPDKRPFFAATYIPREDRFGRVGMLNLVPRIKEIWTSSREEVMRTAAGVSGALQEALSAGHGGPLRENLPAEAEGLLWQSFDARHGGFGDAPKFPSPHNLLFLLRRWRRTGERRCLEMVETTLRAMRNGGIFDHLGFGFHRYSTDETWTVPHFEKMLYDQALLMIAYAEAFQATRKAAYRATLDEIAAYVLGDMTSAEGGFFSAEDADTEGGEGRFYVWRKDEMTEVLSACEADLVVRYYNVEDRGNFTDGATGTRPGTNILHVTSSLDVVGRNLGLEPEEARATLEAARKKLLAHRRSRPGPLKDDKVLTDWNGLMVAGMARAAWVTARGDYLEAAGRAADFIVRIMRAGDGRLFHAYRLGRAGIQANLDDYAYLVWGLLELYESGFSPRYLDLALEINAVMVEDFADRDNGGFYFTPAGRHDLPLRRKDAYDGALPSGNSVAVLNLLRLGRITGREEMADLAEKAGESAAGLVERAPAGHTYLLAALDFAAGPDQEVVVAGSGEGRDTGAFLDALRSRFLPNAVVLLKSEDRSDSIARLAPHVAGMAPVGERATAYVCSDYACESPTDDPNVMLDLLDKVGPRKED
jgi:uncharacterized protein YyaL (SSP411 family)